MNMENKKQLGKNSVNNEARKEIVKESENKKNIKVLFSAFEATPFAKTGGLADVASALPKYLNEINVDARIMMPLFGFVAEKYKRKMKKLKEFYVPFGWRNQYIGLYEYSFDNKIYYFLDNEYYFKRENIYGYFDDGERIAFFSKAILESIQYLDFEVDILHLNDWHNALSCVYLREMYQEIDKCKRIKTLLTIHNLKFQGKFDAKMLNDPLDLYGYKNARNQLLEQDAVNFMRGGLCYADYITTVSPTYAEEIKKPFFGEGLQDIFCRRNNVFKGIINGIDYELYNPNTDKYIFANYDINNLESKTINKINLQKELGLEQSENKCMIGMVTRLAEQKGIDLLLTIFEEMINTLDIQFVLLGEGEERYQNSFRFFENKYKGKVSSSICFSEERSRKIYAASDLFLVPSIFEPCGLSQLIAMRYLTLPIVRETGGLKDTVIPFNKYTNEGTGFSFQNINAHELLFTIKDAVNLYYKNKDVFKKLLVNGSGLDFSWKNSAKEYEKVYKTLLSY